MQITLTFKRIAVSILALVALLGGYMAYQHEVAQNRAINSLYGYVEQGVKAKIFPDAAQIQMKIKQDEAKATSPAEALK